jgi:hypothetical protein
VVYGQSWYLQYFAPIFAAGCAIVGISCYIRIKRRGTIPADRVPADPEQSGQVAPDGAPG